MIGFIRLDAQSIEKIAVMTLSRYQRKTFLVRTLKLILSHLHWAQLRRIRPGHFQKVIRLFSQVMK